PRWRCHSIGRGMDGQSDSEAGINRGRVTGKSNKFRDSARSASIHRASRQTVSKTDRAFGATVANVEESQPSDTRMKLRYPGACRVCQAELPQRAEAIYDKVTKTVRCIDHDEVRAPTQTESEATIAEPDSLQVDVGIPGASARRE